MNLCVSIVVIGALVACMPTPPKPLAAGPISYYDGACAHCHGQNGTAYSATFFKKYDIAPLTKSIQEMADGPGQSPLDAEGLKAQVAYHQAIIAKLPFVAWTGQSGSKLSGEVTRKATMVASLGRERLPVTIKGIKWSLELPSGANLEDLAVTATLANRSTTWRPKSAAFSTPPNWPPKSVN